MIIEQLFKILFVPLRAVMEEGIKNYELRIKRAHALDFIGKLDLSFKIWQQNII